MAGQFRYTVWDPWMIICQITTLQCVFYVSLGLWITLFDVLSGNSRSLDQIFKYQELQGTSLNGKLLIAAYICNSLNCSLGLWYIVQRTKLCLDFACTVHLVHLIFCLWWNSGLPIAPSWWIINLVCTSILCVTGEFLCMRTELKYIPVNMAPKSDL
uniref:Protein SYS1 homolog n=1 Tax=Pseudodiaptomus poplesia TaxID=213370 RepID=A0A1S6GL61_9MAXI|nr:sys1-like protein [Pseudodiaptomus poplesia]